MASEASSDAMQEDLDKIRGSTPGLDVPLAAAESAAGSIFEATAAESTLPAPPGTVDADPAAVHVKRSLNTALPEAPLSRAKRPKSVKFSPAKGGDGRARRVVSTAATAQARATAVALGLPVEPEAIPNNEFCDTCGGRGHFLCCDGCPRSFHFACLDPPVPLDEVPAESWYCKVCQAQERPKPSVPPMKSLFGPLIAKADTENAKVFKLPDAIKAYFQSVSSTSAGDFVDLQGIKPARLNKHGLPEERDPFKTRDRTGRDILCTQCGKAASQARGQRILGCDFCERHWHLDCLDPPLTAIPPTSHRWKCPLHADNAVPKRRQPKNQVVLTQTERNMPNNGMIDVIPKNRNVKKREGIPDYHDTVLNGVRYQVPEETIILDFWDKINGVRNTSGFRLAKSGRVVAEKPPIDSDASSPLSSISSSSESSPEPPSKSLPQITAPSLKLQEAQSNAADRVVAPASSSTLPIDGMRTASPSSAGTSRLPSPFTPIEPLPNSKRTSSLLPPQHDEASADLGAPPSMLTTDASTNASTSASMTPAASTDGAAVASPAPPPLASPFKVKLNVPSLNNHVKRDTRSRTSSPGPGASTRSRTSSPAPPSSTAAVPKASTSTDAMDVDSDSNGGSAQPSSSSPAPPRRLNGSSLTPGVLPPPSQLRHSVIAEPIASTSRLPASSASQPPPVPTERHTTSPSAARPSVSPPIPVVAPTKVSPPPSVPMQAPGMASSSSNGSAKQQQLAVRSKEDMKALAHVRKMMRGEGYTGQRDTLLDFLGADSPPIPKMPFLDSAQASPPWELPWDQQQQQQKSG